jgi:outer membrane protein OmpA-like peptidoglycan-associated protein
LALAFAGVLAAAGVMTAQEQETDAEGCKDHPLLSRMKNFYISECRANFYDALEVYLNDSDMKTVEGNKTHINYRLKEGSAQPSDLQIRRNYTNALKTLGGKLLFERESYAAWTLQKGGKEFWITLQVYDDGWQHDLNIVEIAAMEQEVTANQMLDALNKDGFMALYINFDTGKADIKPESMPIIDQIAALMNGNAGLKLGIEGHTDNVGTPAANKTLSEARAKAVMAAVVKAGVDAARLSAVGWGQEKPVADNRSEDGRAKNRRVEIVKK